MTRVLLVDDHSAFRQPLAFMLERVHDITVVGQAGSVAEARTMLGDVDVAVIDLDLGDGTGMDLIPELRAANPDGQVLVLTASASRDDFARAVQSGAAGVMHKSSGLNEIIDSGQRLGRGEQVTHPRDVADLVSRLDRRRGEEMQGRSHFDQLTAREQEVLEALAQGLSDREIGERLSIGTETVRTHMAKILDKLEVHSRLQAVVYAIRLGLVELS